MCDVKGICVFDVKGVCVSVCDRCVCACDVKGSLQVCVCLMLKMCICVGDVKGSL